VSERERSRLERGEQWFIMEWIVAGGRRLWLIVGIVVALVLATVGFIVYAQAVGRLNHSQLKHFERFQEERQHPYGPLFERIHHSP
jgi:hypothetical protein